MKPTRLAAKTLAAIASIVLVGCKDIPLLPKWNSDEQLPLASQKITVSPPFPAGVPVPNGTSQNVSFPAQTQTIDGLVGQILKPGLVAASIVSVITKTVTVSGADTLFIAQTQADLTNPAATRIVVPLSIVAANAKDSSQAVVTAAGLTMLQNVANASGPLWIQMRGLATCVNAAGCTFAAGDSVGVRLTLLATVPISR
ncbi:MAG: hypothetical protein ACHQU8_04175 [Gemmatimonadales bacterium]